MMDMGGGERAGYSACVRERSSLDLEVSLVSEKYSCISVINLRLTFYFTLVVFDVNSRVPFSDDISNNNKVDGSRVRISPEASYISTALVPTVPP